MPQQHSLPPHPSLEWLRRAAKERLEALRAAQPDVKLAAAQLALAREYGFRSWRALKAHIDALTVEGRLVRAALDGDAEALDTMLATHPGSLVTVTGGPWRQPLLHLAAAAGHLAAVDVLLRRGFPVNLRDHGDSAYALHFAAEAGHLPVVRRLVEAGGDIHGDGDDHELGVVGWATCLRGVRQDVAEYLLGMGARLHIFAAIALNRADDVRRMVEADAAVLRKPMSRNEHRRRPLHHAVAVNRPEMVELLLELGADPDDRDDAGATPAAYAVRCAADPAIVARLAGGDRPNLLLALANERYEDAERVLAAEPDLLCGREQRILHFMVAQRRAHAVQWLVDHGADVNLKQVIWEVNQTPLHICSEHGLVDIARLLLDAGADPNIADDRFNATCLGWAQHCRQPAMIELLRERGGR